ncbi:MAG: OmpH family outer membrane protein [Hyphomonadaceae bacterium]|nr:OmpH family outer membrane protein [Hyphomonadaceae bacterium]
MKLRNLALAAAFTAGFANMAGVAVAQTKVYVVNEELVRRESKVGKEINSTLVTNANAGADQLGLKALKTEIDTEAQRLKPQTESLTPEALNGNATLKAQVEALGKKQAEYYQKSNALNNGLERADNGLSQMFFIVLGPAVDAVAKDVGADVVIAANSTWYVKDAIDISTKVVARLDATVPTLKALQDAMPKPPAGAAPKPPGGGR